MSNKIELVGGPHDGTILPGSGNIAKTISMAVRGWTHQYRRREDVCDKGPTCPYDYVGASKVKVKQR